MFTENWQQVAGRTSRPQGGAVTRGAGSARRAVLRVGARLFNPVLRRLAGRHALPLFAVIHHRGRLSGRAYATPVAARPTAEGFVIPLTFGQQADWFRNLQAAGGGVVTWKAVEYPVEEPEVVDVAAVRSAFSPVERRLLPVFGIKEVVRVRRAAPGDDGAHAAIPPRREPDETITR